ncbi:MAG TPA: hypothetical protein VG326_02280 [Tepidisphaeraceae bacterium]|jgi:hypothetical protein|nr:hypothetical protein [Tepidisphaeraceae bacterium]
MTKERDIDQIAASVRQSLPDVQIDQWIKLSPTDDDGLWYFRRPGANGEIQLESSSGNCPFTVESDAMKNSTQAVQAKTPDAAVQLITQFLAGSAATQKKG